MALAISAALLAACSQQPSAAPDPDSEQAYADSELSPIPAADVEDSSVENHVATASVPMVKAYEEPDADEPIATFEHPGPYGTPRVFLVLEEDEGWLRVLLPMRPNETEGWVRSRDVVLASNPYRIDIDLSDFQIQMFKDERMILETSAAVGTGGTPTPTGLFFTTILAKPQDPASPYGPYAYGLSGYSEVLNTFAGGDGQIAIHGTNQPDLIGTAVSHGCVRVDNRTIMKIAKQVPLGTPVRIHR